MEIFPPPQYNPEYIENATAPPFHQSNHTY